MSSEPEETFVDLMFDVMNVIQQAVRKKMEEQRFSDAITGPRLRIMWTILKTGQMRMSDIAAAMGVQPRTMTQYIDSLEAAGFVHRGPDPTDRRAVLIKLSEAAIPLVEQTRTIINDLNKEITASIGSEELVKLTNALKKMKESSEKKAVPSSPNEA
jgi:DNA-binding MarR family transcriptional regulator